MENLWELLIGSSDEVADPSLNIVMAEQWHVVTAVLFVGNLNRLPELPESDLQIPI